MATCETFLGRLASGYLPHLSAVITSRFPIADLDDADHRTWYQARLMLIEIERADRCIDLLRQA